jgi:excinuclease UvrABC nuclease subunit
MIKFNGNSVRETVDEYCNKYGISPAFKPSEMYDLKLDWTTKNYPNATDYGCYVFYSELNELLYVGKASLADLGSRLSCHFRRDTTQAVPVDRWEPPARFLQNIPVHESHEAPSLEEYLINTLRPRYNKAVSRSARKGAKQPR